MTEDKRPEENKTDKIIHKALDVFSGPPADMMIRFTPLLFLIIVLAIIGMGQFGTPSDKPLLEQLSDRSTARGLITLLFSIGTIWIAMLLAVSAMSGDGDDKRFNRGKEVLTILVGILGAIIGYYFGVESQQPTREQRREETPVTMTEELSTQRRTGQGDSGTPEGPTKAKE